MVSNLKAGEILLVEKENLPELFKDENFKKQLCEQFQIFLPSKRWYSSKDDSISSISIQKIFPLNDKYGTHFIIIKVMLSGGEEPLYSIPVRLAWDEKARTLFAEQPQSVVATVCFGQKLGIVYDAAGDTEFASAVLELMFENAAVQLEQGVSLAASATAAGKELIKQTRGAAQKLLGVEQSNSSIVIGKKIILKMYRRVALGKHPEVATTSFLTQVASFKNTPAYLGVIALDNKGGEPLALGILQEFVPNEGDGWNYTMNYLKKFFADALNKKTAGGYHAAYLETVKILGKRTAEMHKAFAQGKDEVFAPEPISSADLDAWREQVLAQSEKTQAVIRSGIDNLSGETKDKTELLLKHWDNLVERMNALVPVEVSAVKTRFHGDYHLGQVVVADNDFYILDFEGEPLRPLMERQIKHTVLKDVAGMVRSFDYAAFGALLMYVLPEHRAILMPAVADWQKQATESFLAGYFENMGDCPCLPADKKTAQNLLDLFVLEKAMYEVIYEVANRPDWVAIPVNGMARLVDLDGESK